MLGTVNGSMLFTLGLLENDNVNSYRLREFQNILMTAGRKRICDIPRKSGSRRGTDIWSAFHDITTVIIMYEPHIKPSC
jgi:hypothetical protein